MRRLGLSRGQVLLDAVMLAIAACWVVQLALGDASSGVVWVELASIACVLAAQLLGARRRRGQSGRGRPTAADTFPAQR